MPRFSTFVLIACIATAASGALAQDNQRLRVRSLAASCAACHGLNGRAADAAAVPSLAGRDAKALIDAMRAYKRGERQGTVMPQLAKGYSDAQIEQLAGYFAAQPP